MTAKHGTQWKTSWRRQKPNAVSQYPMWFFNSFGVNLNGAPKAQYQMSDPATGDGVAPFWVGLVAAVDVAIGPNESYTGFVGRTARWNVGAGNGGSGIRANGTTVAGGSSTDHIWASGANIRAVVVLMTVEPNPSGPGSVTKIYIDSKAPLVDVDPATYTPGPPTLTTFLTRVQPAVPLVGAYINGWAGGNFALTTAEIGQWFADVRANLETAAIPGKTSDRFSATSVAPTRPAVLPNLAGGGPMTYAVTQVPDPVALNTLVPVTFAY